MDRRKPLKVLLCGPRKWLDQKPIEDVLQTFPQGTILVHGGARGADIIAGYVGRALGFEVRRYAVDHTLDGPWPQAGPRRNSRMLEAEHPDEAGWPIDVGIALKLEPELSKGTRDMVLKLRKASPVIEVREICWQHGILKCT